jgi:KDO2-lipid IV(A) lauroyltransferase
MKFLNQDTGVLFGTELMAKKYNYPVIYGRIMKVKRGYYTLEWEKVCEDPSKTEKGEITRDITTILEKDINADPQYWLWSHRRWKHEKPADK